MACCGRQRSATGATAGTLPGRPVRERAPAAGVGLTADRSAAYFQYVGATAVVVTGGATGARYHFARAGAVVPVDARDRRSVAQLPMLRQVAGPS